MPTTQTYAQQQGHQPHNWNDFLAKSYHSEGEWQRAKDLAKGWVTCACGTQCAALARFPGGKPVDKVLAELGDKFYRAIVLRKRHLAREILAQIEARSAELLAAL